jgi:VanZ family protein
MKMSVRRWVGLWFLTALFCLSLLPESVKGRLGMSRPVHFLAHVAAFCTGYLLTASPNRNAGRKSTLQNVWIALVLMAFGALIEFLEASLYHNSLEVRDVIADGAGIFLGILIYAMLPARHGLRQV